MRVVQLNEFVDWNFGRTSPIYEVYFWPQQDDGFSVDIDLGEQYLLEGFTDVVAVLTWAQDHANNRKYSVFLWGIRGNVDFARNWLIYGELPLSLKDDNISGDEI